MGRPAALRDVGTDADAGQPTVRGAVGARGQPDARYQLAYDADNRLAVVVMQGGATTTYTYDDDARTTTIDTGNGAFHGVIEFDEQNRELSEVWGGTDPSAQQSANDVRVRRRSPARRDDHARARARRSVTRRGRYAALRLRSRSAGRLRRAAPRLSSRVIAPPRHRVPEIHALAVPTGANARRRSTLRHSLPPCVPCSPPPARPPRPTPTAARAPRSRRTSERRGHRRRVRRRHRVRTATPRPTFATRTRTTPPGELTHAEGVFTAGGPDDSIDYGYDAAGDFTEHDREPTARARRSPIDRDLRRDDNLMTDYAWSRQRRRLRRRVGLRDVERSSAPWQPDARGRHRDRAGRASATRSRTTPTAGSRPPRPTPAMRRHTPTTTRPARSPSTPATARSPA